MSERRFFGFEKLEIYHLSVELTAAVYGLTTSFPADERFGLTNQLRRAASSVTLNIAEGAGRESARDFAHFLMQSRGSVYEVASALQLAVRLGYLQLTQIQDATAQAQTIAAKLSVLARNLRAKP